MAPRSRVPTGKSSEVAGRFTWQDVAAHNNEQSAWIIYNSKVYDITNFADRHPGGRELIMLAAGRDCTELFDQYHCLSLEKAQEMIAKFEIGSLDPTAPREFPIYRPDDGFYREVSQQVRDYFVKSGKNPKSPVGGILRMIPTLSIAAVTFMLYTGLLYPESSMWFKTLAAIVFGVFQVLPLLHVMHDSSHASIGNTEGWWKFFGRGSLDWLAGASMMSWHHQHTLGHHIYTNVFLADPDIPYRVSGDMRRVVPRQVWGWIYKYQHIYLPFIYGLLTIKFRVEDIIGNIFTKQNGPIRVNTYDNTFFRIIVVKLVWVLWRVVLPMYYGPLTGAQMALLFLVSELAGGYWLSWNFQVSHVTEDVLFLNSKQPTATLPISWAHAQVKTSLNYGHNDALTTFCCGALNYQIEHHLFPGISQYHYPAIAPIVQRVCKKYSLPYRYEPNFFAAFRCHISYLYRMGQKGIGVSVDA